MRRREIATVGFLRLAGRLGLLERVFLRSERQLQYGVVPVDLNV